MGQHLRLLLGILGLALGSGCTTTHVPTPPPGNPFANYLSDLLQPVMVLGVQVGAYRIQEKKWPAFVDDLSSLPDLDPAWTKSLATFHKVTFTQRADGSLAIAGKRPSPNFAGRAVTMQKEIEFTIRVTLRPAPDTAAGWVPHVEADFPSERQTPKPI